MRKVVKLTYFVLLTLLISSCSPKSNNSLQGYIEGRYTYVATSESGILKKLLVERGNTVKRGDKLLVLDPQPQSDLYKAAEENLKQAIASRDAIAANLVFAKITFERYLILVPKQAIQQSLLDNAKSTYNSLQAQLIQANATIAASTAALSQAKWSTQQKILNAPVDAMVFDTYYRLGEYTEANKAIISLLAPTDIKAIFYVPETMLGKMHVEDTVSVRCDGCVKSYRGKISFISPTAEYTPPVIYSNETNSKLIYRIEASFAPKDAFNLHPGQPIYVTYPAHE